MIIVDVLPDDLIIIKPRRFWKWGILHISLATVIYQHNLRAMRCLSYMITLVEELLQELAIPFEREKRKVKQAFRHIGHSHG